MIEKHPPSRVLAVNEVLVARPQQLVGAEEEPGQWFDHRPQLLANGQVLRVGCQQTCSARVDPQFMVLDCLDDGRALLCRQVSIAAHSSVQRLQHRLQRGQIRLQVGLQLSPPQGAPCFTLLTLLLLQLAQPGAFRSCSLCERHQQQHRVLVCQPFEFACPSLMLHRCAGPEPALGHIQPAADQGPVDGFLVCPDGQRGGRKARGPGVAQAKPLRPPLWPKDTGSSHL